MRHERLLEPISEAEPCGPDLDEIDDPDFRNYVGAAETNLPASFFARRDDEEAKAINLDGELQAIDGLLKRSRHLRLLVLEARLQAFYGSLEGFAGVVEAIASLVERFWLEVHPRGEGDDFTRRSNLVRSLEDLRQVVIPLQHRVLLRDRRLGPFTMRRELVASGLVQARQEEEKGDPETIRRRLREGENLEALQEAYRAAKATSGSLNRLRATFIERSGYDHAPSFDGLLGFLKKTLEFLLEVHPDIDGEAPEAAAAPAAESDEPEALPAAGGPPRPSGNAASIGNREGAAMALAAAEGYFLRNEPSAPALILVRQARRLMGRSLVEAVAALMPGAADGMAITFKGHPALRIDMAGMRDISGSVLGSVVEPDGNGVVAAAATRAEASALLAGVEAFLREAEPASAVPILLKRARDWLGKDFAALVGEMLPVEN